MRRILNKILLLFSLSIFGTSVLSVSQHWDYDEMLVDLTKQLTTKVSSETITAEIETAIQQSQFKDAKMYLDIAKTNNYKIDYDSYHNEITKKDTSLNRVIHNISNFTSGFTKGKSDNVAGLAGSISADFTVVGDARDLYQQYGYYEKGENVNELIVVLSGAGIGLTALTVGTIGSAAPAKAGTSILKVAAKSQKLTKPFQKILLRNGKKVFDWATFTRIAKQNKSMTNLRRAAKQAYHPKAIKPLQKMAGQVNNIRKSSSSIDAIHLLKYVDDSNDLRHLEKLTLKHGSKTKGLFKLVGKGALRTVRVLRKTTALVVSVLSSFASGLLSVFLMFSRVTRRSI